MKTITTDFLIIGGGIIGITIALELKQRFPDQTITLIEKEPECGLHASSRNSGVLHAGFYYTANSLKAQLTRTGNQQLTQYCLQKNLSLKPCGKLVVARHEAELAVLDELLLRAKTNNVELHDITATDAQKIEPCVKTHQRALYSPTTASVNPKQVMQSLVADAIANGIHIQTNTQYLKKSGNNITTNQGTIASGYVINAAGLYADKVAHQYGFGLNYRILPFKGLYLSSQQKTLQLNTHIYPVPNLEQPFLGVHFTLTATGQLKIGPTAIPALWREQYQGLKRLNLPQIWQTLSLSTTLFIDNKNHFRQLASSELKKYKQSYLINAASQLVQNLDLRSFQQWGTPGIRAQLINTDNSQLEMDFVIKGDHQSFHVLNAVSPAFTCAMPFATYCVDHIILFTSTV